MHSWSLFPKSFPSAEGSPESEQGFGRGLEETLYIYIYIYTHKQGNINKQLNNCVYVYIYISIHMYVYIYIYIHIHTDTHTHFLGGELGKVVNDSWALSLCGC